MKPYNQIIIIDGREITSVVCDEQDFHDALELLHDVIVINDNNSRAGQNQIDKLKKEKFLPMAKRGTRTEPIFNKFGVKTEYMTCCVRGFSKTAIEKGVVSEQDIKRLVDDLESGRIVVRKENGQEN